MGDVQTCNQIYPKNITTQIELFQEQAKMIAVFPFEDMCTSEFEPSVCKFLHLVQLIITR